jgi:hypothetical protein
VDGAAVDAGLGDGFGDGESGGEGGQDGGLLEGERFVVRDSGLRHKAAFREER